jgi:hypothetical protein
MRRVSGDRWRIRGIRGAMTLVRWVDATREERAAAFKGLQASSAFDWATSLTRFQDHDRAMARLLRVPEGRTGRDLNQEIRAAIDNGSILIIETLFPARTERADVSAPPPEPPLFAEAPPELRTIELERRYHDDEPLQGAPFELQLSDGRTVTGKLDKFGRARVEGVSPGVAHVRFGPDERPWEPVDQRVSPAFRENFNEADVRALIARHRGTR